MATSAGFPCQILVGLVQLFHIRSLFKKKLVMDPEGIVTRRNLPHWYVPGAMHFVTYRLADTIPNAVLHDLRQKRQARLHKKPTAGMSLATHQANTHKQFFAEYDAYLDRGGTVNWLASPAIAAMIRGNLYHHNGSKYDLLAYCVMPNHVHVLLQPRYTAAQPPSDAEASEPDERPDHQSPLSEVMHSLKSYTAHEANKLLRRSGQFWQHESYDHWVRDEDELERIVKYIAWNPARANLVQKPHQWYFSSAHDRFLLDGTELAFLPSGMHLPVASPG
jgi:putative DNA methylase